MSFLYLRLVFLLLLFFFFFFILFIGKYLDVILSLYFPLLFLLFFIILPEPDNRFNPVSFRAFIPCFFNDCFKSFLPFILSLTTEETNCFAAGLAALNINGNTLLAINENIPALLLFPTER